MFKAFLLQYWCIAVKDTLSIVIFQGEEQNYWQGGVHSACNIENMGVAWGRG